MKNTKAELNDKELENITGGIKVVVKEKEERKKT